MTSSGHAYIRALRDAETPREAFETVRAALADPSVFFYGSILLCPGFKMAQERASSGQESSEGTSLAALLTLMSYGTMGDVSERGEPSGNIAKEVLTTALPLLTDGQKRKLQTLSVLSFYTKCGNGRTEIPYAEWQAYLGCEDAAMMEDVMVGAVSNGFLKARLNPREGIVYVVELLQARDVSPREVKVLYRKMKAWQITCDRQLKQLDRAVTACEESDKRMLALATLSHTERPTENA